MACSSNPGDICPPKPVDLPPVCTPGTHLYCPGIIFVEVPASACSCLPDVSTPPNFSTGSCPPGQVPIGTLPEGTRICATPVPPPVVCQIAITYAEPKMPTVSVTPSNCDQAGIELAIGIILARMLGAP